MDLYTEVHNKEYKIGDVNIQNVWLCLMKLQMSREI